MNRTIDTSKLPKALMKSIGVGVLALIIANLGYFVFDLIEVGFSEFSSFKFKHGVFHLNGESNGMPVGSAKGIRFMLLFFGLSMINQYRKGNLSSVEPNVQ